MKKETKRYMIVEYAGFKQREYNSKQELNNALDSIRKANNRKKEKYIFGNVSTVFIDGKYYMTVHLYNKLTFKNTISDVDNFTKNFNKSELEAYFSSKSIMKEGYESDINIAYFESKDATDENKHPLLYGVKYIPVLYKDDLRFFDEDFIKKCLRYHADQCDYEFFSRMIDEFRFHNAIGKQLDELFSTIDKVKNQGLNRFVLSDVAWKLYRNLIYEREKDGSIVRDNNGVYQISVRRQRDFSFFLKNHDASKRNSPLKYNGSTTKMKKENLINLREELLKRQDIKTLELK